MAVMKKNSRKEAFEGRLRNRHCQGKADTLLLPPGKQKALPTSTCQRVSTKDILDMKGTLSSECLTGRMQTGDLDDETGNPAGAKSRSMSSFIQRTRGSNAIT